MLSNERVRELLVYDPATGQFWCRATGKEVGLGGPKSRYLFLWLDKKMYRAHRVAWLYVHGYWPDELDHIDRDGCHNAISNLRECTRRENMLNTRELRRNNTTGYCGVIYNKKNRNYRAQIRFNREYIQLGSFATAEAAAAAYQQAKEELSMS